MAGGIVFQRPDKSLVVMLPSRLADNEPAGKSARTANLCGAQADSKWSN